MEKLLEAFGFLRETKLYLPALQIEQCPEPIQLWLKHPLWVVKGRSKLGQRHCCEAGEGDCLGCTSCIASSEESVGH